MVFLKKKIKAEDGTPASVQRASSMPLPRQDRQPGSRPAPPTPGLREDFRPVVMSIQDQEWVHQVSQHLYTSSLCVATPVGVWARGT
jgi:hypothetical protein